MAKSVSKIQCFEQCKNKYKLTYLDKIPLEGQPHLNKGKAIHAMLEDFTNTEIVFNFLKSDLGQKYYNIIKNANKEVKIGLKIANNQLTSCDFFDSDCLFHGVADIVYQNMICDYKTGKAKQYQYQDWTQLEAYALWMFINTDFDEIKVSYLYIEHNTENAKIISRSQVNAIAKKLLLTIRDIKQYDSNPVQEYNLTALCDYCQCNKYCQRYQDITKALQRADHHEDGSLSDLLNL